ncbi:hypothetical protein D4R71_00290 [bacterium]|nr:MAG: hypothetical protein D4R71_00290 [bacterium]
MKKLMILCGLLLTISCSTPIERADAHDPRIVVLSPELAEIVCELGAEDNIIGITQECDYPQTLQQKNIIGSFSAPNIEKIVVLEADAVLLTGMEQEIFKHKLLNLNIPVHQFYPSSIKALYETIFSLGELLHKEDKADSLIQYMQVSISAIAKPRENPTIYIEIYNKPLMTASSGSFVGDVIKKAGLINIFPELPREYCTVSSERVVELNPDIILITYPGVIKKDIKERLGWSMISAIKNDRVFTTEDIDPDIILRAGPRIVQGIEKLSQLSIQQNE